MESETHSTATSNATNFGGPEEFHDLNDDEVYMKLAKLVEDNDIMMAEVTMMERFLIRVEPKDSNLHKGENSQSQSSQSSLQEQGRGPRKRARSRSSTSEGKLFSLSAEQKCEIASREIDELREEKVKLEQEAEKKIDDAKAHIEELAERLSNLKKVEIEFEKDIVQGAVNPRTGKIVAEKALKFIDDRIKKTDTLCEKLHLKNSSLVAQKKKLSQALIKKEEMGEVLLEVDYNQLEIENKQHLDKIEEKNEDLLRLKLIAANTMQVLNSHKRRLGVLQKDADFLKDEIDNRESLRRNLDIEKVQAKDGLNVAKNTHQNFKEYTEAYKVPEVIDYVKERAIVRDLEKEVKVWTRKCDVVQKSQKSVEAQWKKLQTEAQNRKVNPWDAVLQS